ncbi:hypothetical protein [Spiroplasma mirum]|uniref:hypothetical protein n=1 Tax=Spiroplasma mirum TaxID=2144 RepID=UPI0003E0135B|nr:MULTISPECIES: hypothetical protein [Spiroplasma]AHF60504.1 hypothetical protein SMM_0024 [Spiroplasma mirum ATCC 29335]AKM52629.1 hypothetical protein SATRI_v1c00260 [Spiroplasma atrichopogonis]
MVNKTNPFFLKATVENNHHNFELFASLLAIFNYSLFIALFCLFAIITLSLKTRWLIYRKPFNYHQHLFIYLNFFFFILIYTLMSFFHYKNFNDVKISTYYISYLYILYLFLPVWICLMLGVFCKNNLLIKMAKTTMILFLISVLTPVIFLIHYSLILNQLTTLILLSVLSNILKSYLYIFLLVLNYLVLKGLVLTLLCCLLNLIKLKNNYKDWLEIFIIKWQQEALALLKTIYTFELLFSYFKNLRLIKNYKTMTEDPTLAVDYDNYDDKAKMTFSIKALKIFINGWKQSLNN